MSGGTHTNETRPTRAGTSRGEVIESTNLVADSVSAADTGSRMRTADGMYIFNLSTRILTAGRDYTLRIRPGSTTSPWLLQAVLQPRK